jgi:hypothetical protein
MTQGVVRQEGSAFSRFMAGCGGRMARVALGTGLVVGGAGVVGGATGVAVSLFGLVPLTTGVFNLCPIAPAWGGHFFGARYCARSDE